MKRIILQLFIISSIYLFAGQTDPDAIIKVTGKEQYKYFYLTDYMYAGNNKDLIKIYNEKNEEVPYFLSKYNYNKSNMITDSFLGEITENENEDNEDLKRELIIKFEKNNENIAVVGNKIILNVNFDRVKYTNELSTSDNMHPMLKQDIFGSNDGVNWEKIDAFINDKVNNITDVTEEMQFEYIFPKENYEFYKIVMPDKEYIKILSASLELEEEFLDDWKIDYCNLKVRSKYIEKEKYTLIYIATGRLPISGIRLYTSNIDVECEYDIFLSEDEMKKNKSVIKNNHGIIYRNENTEDMSINFDEVADDAVNAKEIILKLKNSNSGKINIIGIIGKFYPEKLIFLGRSLDNNQIDYKLLFDKNGQNEKNINSYFENNKKYDIVLIPQDQVEIEKIKKDVINLPSDKKSFFYKDILYKFVIGGICLLLLFLILYLVKSLIRKNKN